MKILNHNNTFTNRLYIIVAIAAILVGILWYCNTTALEIYAVYPHIKGLKKNDKVLIENVPVGQVKSIRFNENGASSLIVSIEINRDFNIPDKSIAEIVPFDLTTNIMGINISLVASNQYLEHGDTILTYTDTNLIDSLINISKSVSQVIKDSLVVKEKTYNYLSVDPVFKVQILVSKSMFLENDAAFKSVPNVTFYFENDFYKYVAGNFRSNKEAKTFCEIVKNKGFKDAFVVAFMKGKRISMKEANELLKN